jgi:hypothetical protein
MACYRPIAPLPTQGYRIMAGQNVERTRMTQPQPPVIDDHMVVARARQALCCADATIAAWHVAALHHAHEATLGVYRVHGRAQAGSADIPWSLVLKVVDTSYPAATRELQAYGSGLLAGLPGIGAPHCYGIDQRPDRCAWLWLEDLGSSVAQPWSIAEYERAARDLGRFNGAYLSGRALPDASWLSRDLLHSLVQERQAERAMLRAPATWAQPLVRSLYPEPFTTRLGRLWAAEEPLLQALVKLPRTLCHHDFWRPNLCGRNRSGIDETVAIDWALVGHGALGEDLGQFVGGTLLLAETEDEIALQLGPAALHGYLDGLADAGWYGDWRLVQFAYAAAAALRWGIAAPGILLALDTERHALLEQRRGMPIATIVARRARAAHILLDLGETALGLAGELALT